MTTNPLALAVVVAYCRWDPTTAFTGTTKLSGKGTLIIQLPSLMVTAVTSVAVTDASGDSYTLTVGQGGGHDVEWSEEGTLEMNPAGPMCWSTWPYGRGNVSATWSGGYDTLPDDLSAALDNITARLPSMGVTSTKIGTAQITYAQQIAAGGLLLVESMVLDRYRIVAAS